MIFILIFSKQSERLHVSSNLCFGFGHVDFFFLHGYNKNYSNTAAEIL